MMLELEDESELDEEATELLPFFATVATNSQTEDADELRRRALAKRLQSTPVGRALSRMGAKITIERPPLQYAAHWARGQLGFEVQCGGQQPQTNVIFGIFDKDSKWVAFYLFSSTIDPKIRLACKRSGARPIVRAPFGVDHGAATATHDLFKKQIAVDELVKDATSPSATIHLDTTSGGITCIVKGLNTKSNGRVHLTFGLHKNAQPSRANITIPGKLFFLQIESFDDDKFQKPNTPLSPLRKAERIAISRF